MKRSVSLMLCVLLILCAAVPALAEAPAPNSLNARLVTVRNNTSFTPESYPEIWITPVYADYIIAGTDPEKYPAHFLRFAPPEGAAPMTFQYDSATFIDHDALLVYYYNAYDRASFELFLEKAEPEFTISDGSDGVAAYVSPDSRRARAMIDLKPFFGGTSKLEIVVDSYDRGVTDDQLTEMIQAEVKRVQDAMTSVELDGYWSAGVFESVELGNDYDQVNVILDTTDLTITTLDSYRLKFMEPNGRYSRATEIEITTSSFAHYQAEQGEDAPDEALSDGTPYKRYSSEYTSYASFLLLEEGKHGPVYLSVKIDCEPDAFPDLLEQVYARVTR